MALDPSKGGDARRGDYSAYVMLGIDAAGVDLCRGRSGPPADAADGGRRRGAVRAVPAARRSASRPISFRSCCAASSRRSSRGSKWPASCRPRFTTTSNKLVRIRRLGPYLSQRRLRFLASSASTRLLVDQLRDFPAAAHDDGPDALEMALRLAEEVWQGRNADDGLGDRLIATNASVTSSNSRRNAEERRGNHDDTTTRRRQRMIHMLRISSCRCAVVVDPICDPASCALRETLDILFNGRTTCITIKWTSNRLENTAARSLRRAVGRLCRSARGVCRRRRAVVDAGRRARGRRTTAARCADQRAAAARAARPVPAAGGGQRVCDQRA